MRTGLLLTVAGLALIIPFTALAPTWGPGSCQDRAASAEPPELSMPEAGVSVRLDTSLGILPLPDAGSSGELASEDAGEHPAGASADDQDPVPSSAAQGAELDIASGKMHCEGGVCRLGDEKPAERAERPHLRPWPPSRSEAISSAGPMSWQAAERRLRQAGATAYRLEVSLVDGQARCTCELPEQNGGARTFTATGNGPLPALAAVVSEIERSRLQVAQSGQPLTSE